MATLRLTCLLALASAQIARGSEEADFTVIVVGGAGGDEASVTLAGLQARLQSLSPANSVVVFTGNYAAGELPEAGAPGRAAVERSVLAHVTATSDFVRRGGKIYFLPGARDFAGGGSRAILRLRAFLNQHFEAALGGREKIDVMPGASCGDPTVLELTDDLGLMLVNSQWWMQDWEADPDANDGCRSKSREAAQDQIRAAFNDYRTRRLIVATHHPLLSYGQFGGAFTASAHLSPAPVVGTLAILARKAGLVPQYQNHPRVQLFLGELEEQAAKLGPLFFVSGHDGNLQFLKVNEQLQIISGSSAGAADPVVGAGRGEFAAATSGWAELEIDASGGGRVRFVSGQAGGCVLFETTLPPVRPLGEALHGPPPALPQGPVVSTYSTNRIPKLGALGKFFAGSLYSDSYHLELPFPVLDLKTEAGGLEPLKTGGNRQTNALRLLDPAGGEWVLRPLTKESRRLIAGGGGGGGLTAYAFTGAHPEAALAVARLEQAVGVLHAEPRLMFLPDQEALGKFRGYLGNEVVFLERRASEPREGTLPVSLAGPPSPAGKTKFHDTAHTLEKVLDDPLEHRLDQEAMLRARLLDLFVGDWDRHEGQWRFAEIPNPDGTRTYEPISRDHDQAFSNHDAFLLTIAHTGSPESRELVPFNAEYGDLVWLTNTARNLDPVALNALSRERWKAIAAQMKADLTDAVIDEALATWHTEAWQLDGARIAAALKRRRDQLDSVAEEFFDRVNRHAEIVGSKHDDTFEVWFEAEGRVRVKLPWFERVYDPAQTSELWIYGREGNDTLRVHGTPGAAIVIRFVGGSGEDLVVAADARPGGEPLEASAIRLYDTEQGGRIDPSIAISDQRSSVRALNEYDRLENHEPSAWTLIEGLRANPDEGALIGADYTYTAHGYKTTPFAARHLLAGRFATATLGATLQYEGLFPQSAGGLDQDVEVWLAAPTQTRNFFGLTDAYVDGGKPLDFYRVRQAWYEARYGLSWAFGGERGRVGAQVLGEEIVTEATPGRLVTASSDVGADALGPRAFAGARLYVRGHTFDDVTWPTHGVGASLSAEGRYDPVEGRAFSTTHKAAIAVAIPFDRGHRFVLQSRVSLEGIVGEHPFYFAPALGDTELRAYHAQQLAGEAAFAQTTDLRIELLRTAGVIGVDLSVDHGRVFGPSSSGDAYHLSCGGSVWWSISNKLGLSLGYYRGLDGGSAFRLAIGPMFAPTAI